MEKGQQVLVKAYPNKTLRRIVLSAAEAYVIVCRPEEYEAAAKLNELELVKVFMGFPKEDVEVVGGLNEGC